jgi:ribosomal protein S18 acetylase RimI-like enzyme
MVPFMNLLVVEEDLRNQGYGSRMIDFWERQMLVRGHDLVMTSSQADERAQHLYRRLGYRDCGALLFPGQIPLEVVFVKSLK